MKKCQKYKDDMMTINFPPFDGHKAECCEIFTFAGFVKPGRHVIIVYDPATCKFYKRDIIVEVRKKDIIISEQNEIETLE